MVVVFMVLRIILNQMHVCMYVGDCVLFLFCCVNESSLILYIILTFKTFSILIIIMYTHKKKSTCVIVFVFLFMCIMIIFCILIFDILYSYLSPCFLKKCEYKLIMRGNNHHLLLNNNININAFRK